MTKILISDPLAKEGVEMLRDGGLEVEERLDLKPEDLIACVGQFDGMIVRGATKVTDKVIEAGTRLKVVARAGVGLDNVDRKAAEKNKVQVLNTPEATSISVAELTIGHLLALLQNIPYGTASLKAGKWEKKKMKGKEASGKTLGLIGLGRIGTEVAKRALALGMTVLAADPDENVKKKVLQGVKMVSFEELLNGSDVISLHLPHTPDTHHIVSKNEFQMMKDGVYVINCARGGVLDENSLYEALQSGKIAGAALDVFEKEPPSDFKLMNLENVIGTPHIGASTKEGQVRAGIDVAKKVLEFFKASM
jgi:D-3-phosphoglycerate dehydrogenase